MSVSVDSGRVREQLDKVLASAAFSRSDRLRKFLRYIVEVTLSGRLELLRELPLGVDVFHRGTDFDPRLDPIVRIDARRLRSRLADYYEGEGAFDELDIVLGRGSYVPSFRIREAAPSIVSLQPRTRSVAVLPFESWNMGSGDHQFGKVLTEEVVSALGQNPNWQIRVWRAEPVHTVEGVQIIVRGGILQTGPFVRVVVNIVDAADNSLLSSQRFERHESAGDELRTDVVHYVLARLGGKALDPEGDSEALHLYLQGCYLVNQGTPEALERAVRCFQNVVERDPRSGRAWAGMSASLNTLLLLGCADPASTPQRMRHAAEKALASELDLPEAKAALAASLALQDGDIAGAQRMLESAIAEHPHFVGPRITYAAYCLLPRGQVAEAKQNLEIALAADPSNPSALYLLGLTQCRAFHYEEARQTLEGMLKIHPNYPACWYQLAEAHRRAGNGEKALAAYQRFEQTCPARHTPPVNALVDGDSPAPIAAAAGRAALVA